MTDLSAIIALTILAQTENEPELYRLRTNTLGNSHRTKRAMHVECMAEKTNASRVLTALFICIGVSSLVGRRVCSVL